MLDRKLQRRMLEQMAVIYPEMVNLATLEEETGKRSITVNAYYLFEHGLISSQPVNLLSDGPTIYSARITATGLDFLENDGGLTAILGVVTVKLHDDTIRDLLLARVDEAPGDPSAKEQLRKAIRSLPADGLKDGVLHILKEGLAQVPDALALLKDAIL